MWYLWRMLDSETAETLMHWTQEMPPQVFLAFPKISSPWKRASSYCNLLLAHFMDNSTTVKNFFYIEKNTNMNSNLSKGQ